jgi:hypothetical protein
VHAREVHQGLRALAEVGVAEQVAGHGLAERSLDRGCAIAPADPREQRCTARHAAVVECERVLVLTPRERDGAPVISRLDGTGDLVASASASTERKPPSRSSSLLKTRSGKCGLRFASGRKYTAQHQPVGGHDDGRRHACSISRAGSHS